MNCCKDCPKRTIGCHITCQTYITAKTQQDTSRERYRRECEVERYLYSMQYKRRKIKKAIGEGSKK